MDFKELEEFGDVIESYLFNKMNKQELDAFKNLMSTNKELEKEVKERSALMFVTQNESLYQIKDVLDRVVADNSISTEPESPPKYNWKFITGLLVLIMVSILFY